MGMCEWESRKVTPIDREQYGSGKTRTRAGYTRDGPGTGHTFHTRRNTRPVTRVPAPVARERGILRFTHGYELKILNLGQKRKFFEFLPYIDEFSLRSNGNGVFDGVYLPSQLTFAKLLKPEERDPKKENECNKTGVFPSLHFCGT